MKREEIRLKLKDFLKDKCVKKLTAQVAYEIKEFLREKYPNQRFGNSNTIDSKFSELFAKGGCISGKIDRCDPFEPTFIIDSVRFSIDCDLSVMVWENDKFALNLDLNNLSEDDITDIKHIGNGSEIDLYRTFIRIPVKDRGKFAEMIPDSLALDLLGDDIPPYAFYKYNGLFYHTTTKGVGDLGGGIGFGGYIKERGSKVQIKNNVVSIGEHAFDCCSNLTEVHISGNVHYVGKHAFSNIPNLIIYCDMVSKPSTWDDEWCDKNCKVVYKKAKSI